MLNVPTSVSWWCQKEKEKEEEQEIEKLFENIMKENVPNLAKELDMQVQEVQRVPKNLDLKGNTPRHILITLPKIKDKERILKAARDKDTVPYKGVSIRLSADFSKETLQARRGWQEEFEVMKGKAYIQDDSIQQSYHLEWKGS